MCVWFSSVDGKAHEHYRSFSGSFASGESCRNLGVCVCIGNLFYFGQGIHCGKKERQTGGQEGGQVSERFSGDTVSCVLVLGFQFVCVSKFD